MPTCPFDGIEPKIHKSSFIAPNAWVTGNVTLGKNVSVFFGTTIRGDINEIVVGEGSNIQDGSMLHTTNNLSTCIIGKHVTIGHHVIVHGAQIDDLCIVGMGSTILDNAKIGKNCLIGANSLVTMNTVIPEGTLAFGNPAKVIRDLTDDEIRHFQVSADNYIKTSQKYKLVFSK